MRQRRAHSGFTLIEILVVLAIVGILAGLSIRGLRSLARSDLRASVTHMAGAIRYLFDRASTTGKYHRLVIDLDQGKYWAEVSDDQFYLPRTPETESSQKKLAELEARLDEKEAQRKELAEASGDIDMTKVLPMDFRPKRARFGAFKETALKPVTLKNTEVMDVFTPRMADPITKGRAYIYFFPLGQTEPAIVHLSDPTEQTIYSLVVHPITGRVRIVNSYVQPPIDVRVDDEGNDAQ
ncbi:MAG TPA: type II secretion system protein [Polyangia bacterium]|jgi:general secretion pathway protein H